MTKKKEISILFCLLFALITIVFAILYAITGLLFIGYLVVLMFASLLSITANIMIWILVCLGFILSISGLNTATRSFWKFLDTYTPAPISSDF